MTECHFISVKGSVLRVYFMKSMGYVCLSLWLCLWATSVVVQASEAVCTPAACLRPSIAKTTPSVAPTAEFLFSRRYAGANLVAANAPANLIDEILFAAQAEAGVPRTYLSEDLNFMRRVSLDLTGRVPNLKRILAFMNDSSADKRIAYIDELLGSEAFIDRWSYWFNELFETTYKVQNARGSAGFAFFYVRKAVAENRSLATMARELITARGNTYSEWETNYLLRAGGLGGNLQDRVDNEATHIADAFLGTSLACISCHDGEGYLDNINLFLSQQTRRNFWETAAFLTFKSIDSENPLASGFNFTDREDTPYVAETEGGNRPPRHGGVIQPRFVLTGAVPEQGENPAVALARFVTEDRMFARNFVNRLWGHMTAVPFVTPYNELDPARLNPDSPPAAPWTLQANQPRLLEALADYFIASDYDLRALLRLIAVSQTYQLSADYTAAWQPEYRDLYVRRTVRELTGEEVFDQFASATDVLDSVGSVYVEAGPHDDVEFGIFQLQFAHQLPDLFNNHVYFDLQRFLTTFGVGNRYDQVRADTMSASQTLKTMRDPLIVNRLGASKTYDEFVPDEEGRFTGHTREVISQLTQLNNSALSDREKIRQTFLAILMREPSRAEWRALAVLTQDQPFLDYVETLQWTLINYSEFRVNY